jgi:molybdopterin-biosynthesis enzyme MoeA-like protein
MGSTHDDVTIAGIAKGMGRPLSLHPVLAELLRKHYPDQVDSAVMKMALVPEGIELIYGENLKTPVLRIENIYIFPGVPEFLRKQFSAIRERFREAPFFVTTLFLNQDEEKMAEGLKRAWAQFPEILIGSYPVLHQEEYKVMVTLESKNKAYLGKGVQALLALLPEGAVWKITDHGE